MNKKLVYSGMTVVDADPRIRIHDFDIGDEHISVFQVRIDNMGWNWAFCNPLHSSQVAAKFFSSQGAFLNECIRLAEKLQPLSPEPKKSLLFHLAYEIRDGDNSYIDREQVYGTRDLADRYAEQRLGSYWGEDGGTDYDEKYGVAYERYGYREVRLLSVTEITTLAVKNLIDGKYIELELVEKKKKKDGVEEHEQ